MCGLQILQGGIVILFYKNYPIDFLWLDYPYSIVNFPILEKFQNFFSVYNYRFNLLNY